MKKFPASCMEFQKFSVTCGKFQTICHIFMPANWHDHRGCKTGIATMHCHKITANNHTFFQ